MAIIHEVQAQDGTNINDGRLTWNANDTAINTELGQVSQALEDHTTSDDHDDRYYTENEIDTMLESQDTAIANLETAFNDTLEGVVHNTGDETIAGKKMFSASPEVNTQAVTSEVILRSKYADTESQSKIASWAYSGYHALLGLMNIGTVANPNWIQAFFMGSVDKAMRFFGDVYAGGKKLATEEYVQSRVRSGTIWKDFNWFGNISGGVSTEKNWLNAGGAPQTFIVTKNCTLVSALLAIISDDGSSAGVMDFTNINLAFNVSAEGARVIFPCLNLTYGNGEYYPKLQIKAFDLNGQNSVIWESGEQQDYSFAAGDWNLCLTLEFQV